MESASPEHLGLDPARIEHFFRVVSRMVEEGTLCGGTFAIARRGRVAALRAVGRTRSEGGREVRPDDLFCLFSTTKPITATALLQRVDRGELLLTDPVARFIPEFAASGKQAVTIAQVLTHTAGFPSLAAESTPETWSDWDATIAAICAQPIEFEPGAAVHYHAFSGYWILAEVVRRLDGGARSFAEICEDEIYRPLGMKDATMVIGDRFEDRRVPVWPLDRGGVPFPMEMLAVFDEAPVRRACVPGAGSYASALDLVRFHQMWLNGGVLDGARLISPALAELARRDHTGDRHDRLIDAMLLANGIAPSPPHRALGFFTRGTGLATNYMGSLATPETFGHAGASSVMAWADPGRELIFVGLTAGLVHESRNVPRWHLLSDLVQAAVVEA